MKYIALFFFFFFSYSNAQGSIWGPSSEKACIEKYVVRAKTEYAGRYLHLACYDLFKDYKISDYLRYMHPRYLNMASNPNTGSHIVYDKIKNVWVEIGQKERKTLSDDFERYVKQEKNKAKCVLNSKEIINAKNEWAAKLAVADSSCYE